MPDLDQLGSFYLGRKHDLSAGKTLPEPVLYDSGDLTTHAVCVGMTGSGKTGLCLALLEEAALDGIPAIAIDPKGDLGNLLLAFPNLEASDFRPWIDPQEAARKKQSPDEFAAAQATLWRDGLAKWDEGPDRIRSYCDATERVIYTPGSSAGIPITVLDSFRAPPPELVADNEAFAERISSAVSGLLGLMGIDADPVRSREHIFLSNILDTAWRAGKDLDLPQLMQQIQRPAMKKVGAVDVETFYPAAERSKLAMSLNNLLASPTFAGWLAGEPLDIQRMLYTKEGKPRLAIVSIAHLDDAQRMFFVTLLLNEILAWVRTQPGTSSLRAILYMDEVYGYFPPSANPPSKRPMLTLLKQARAFGLGCVLATQNPVDLDYKGLSNAGTWFLGRLQTERDKARVIEGLEGASAQAGSKFDKNAMEATLAALGSRVFLMNNVHDDGPVVFHSRWAMSYLCGPLARDQIKRLMDPVRGKYAQGSSGRAERPNAVEAQTSTADSIEKGLGSGVRAGVGSGSGDRPVVPAAIGEKFAVVTERVPDGYRLEYRAGLLAKGKVHFAQKAAGIDVWRDAFVLQSLQATPPDDIWQGSSINSQALSTEDQPDSGGQFAELPSELARAKSYPIFLRQLKDHLYRESSLKLHQCEAIGVISKPGESEIDFRNRLPAHLDQKCSAENDEIKKRFDPQIAIARSQYEKLKSRTSLFRRLLRLAPELWVLIDNYFASRGINLPGRRRPLNAAFRATVNEVDRSSDAKVSAQQAEKNLQELIQARDDELKKVELKYSPTELIIVPFELKPQKGDIQADEVALVWFPYRISPTGVAESVYETSTS